MTTPAPATTRSGAGRLAAWSVFLALALRVLHGPVLGRLSVPLGSIDEVVTWAGRTSPAVMALAVVRLGALLAGWYLTGATVLAVVADVTRWRPLAAIVAVATPRLVLRIASRGAGLGLAAGTLLAVTPLPSPALATPAGAPAEPAGDPRPPPEPAPPAGTTTDPSDEPRREPEPAREPGMSSAGGTADTATMTRLPTGQAGAPSGSTGGVGDRPAPPPGPAGAPAAQPPATATMTRLPDAADGRVRPDPEPGPARTGEAGGPRPDAPLRAGPGPGRATEAVPGGRDPGGRGADASWTVAPGESFWSIAAEVLTDLAGHRPRDRDVRRYWLRLVEANRHRLVDPGNPDLLLPGQRLTLVAPTAAQVAARSPLRQAPR